MIKRRFFVVDIGSSKVSAGLAVCTKAGKILNFYSELAKRNVPSQVNLHFSSDLSDIISSLKASLEEKSGSKLSQAYMNIDSQFVSYRLSRAQTSLSEYNCRPIYFSDVLRLRNQARCLGLRMDEEVIHEFPLKFIVDSDLTTIDPVGRVGRKLEMVLFLLSCNTLGIATLRKVSAQAGLKLKGVTFSGMASTAAILNRREKARNAVIIDIGASSTKIVILLQGYVRAIKVIASAGDNITDSLASFLKIPFALAEELKRKHGSVSAENLDSQEDIMIKSSNSYRSIKRGQVCKGLKPAVEGLINSIKAYLESQGLVDSHVLVCGGTALLDGFLEALENCLSLKVMLGRPDLQHLPVQKRKRSLRDPAQATMVGLLEFARGKSTFIPQSLKVNKRQFLSQFLQHARHLYSEYF